MSRKIYVAGASSEIERAERVMAQLREAGFEVVSTWPEVIRKVGAANPMELPRDDRADFAINDLQQVTEARALWILLPPKPITTIGAWIELGFAYALAVAEQHLAPTQANRYVLCSGVEQSIFTAMADHYATDEEALTFLKSATEPEPEPEPSKEG